VAESTTGGRDDDDAHNTRANYPTHLKLKVGLGSSRTFIVGHRTRKFFGPSALKIEDILAGAHFESLPRDHVV
jgi:hypothetical protein